MVRRKRTLRAANTKNLDPIGSISLNCCGTVLRPRRTTHTLTRITIIIRLFPIGLRHRNVRRAAVTCTHMERIALRLQRTRTHVRHEANHRQENRLSQCGGCRQRLVRTKCSKRLVIQVNSFYRMASRARSIVR